MYMPGPQFLHVVDAHVREYMPAAQVTHGLACAPIVVENEPGSHQSHGCVPTASLYLPMGHIVHLSVAGDIQ